MAQEKIVGEIILGLALLVLGKAPTAPSGQFAKWNCFICVLEGATDSPLPQSFCSAYFLCLAPLCGRSVILSRAPQNTPKKARFRPQASEKAYPPHFCAHPRPATETVPPPRHPHARSAHEPQKCPQAVSTTTEEAAAEAAQNRRTRRGEEPFRVKSTKTRSASKTPHQCPTA